MSWIEDRAKGALEWGEEFEKSQLEKVQGLGFDSQRVSDAEFAMWFEMKIGLVPLPEGVDIKVEPFDYYADVDDKGMPIGALTWRNIWLEHLPLVEGGQELLDRYARAKAKQYQGVT